MGGRDGWNKRTNKQKVKKRFYYTRLYQMNTINGWLYVKRVEEEKRRVKIWRYGVIEMHACFDSRNES